MMQENKRFRGFTLIELMVVMVIVSLPTRAQFTPSLDWYPLKVFPLRTSLTQ